ncbi:MAG: hypothetical protein PHQ65_10155 [Bacteroidales bacterium]|nr:hypothetical protein [Bacteroidales bacterium]MDD3665614.1 hypothetical protein [Bacteroidales bacterium]
MKLNIIKNIVLFSSLVIPMLTFAQPNPGSNAGGGSVGGNPIGGGAAPVGSGIALLLALGAGYGAKRIYDARKKLAE